jgi:hypothetical protein
MIARPIVLLAAVLAALVVAPAARADELDIAGRHLKIEAIDGLCMAESDNPADRLLYSFTDHTSSGVFRTLSIQGDCGGLERYRREQSLKVEIQPSALIQLNLMRGQEAALPMSRAEFLETMNTALTSQYSAEVWELAKQSASDALVRLKEKMGDAIDDATLEEQKVLGVIDRDDLGVYIGIVQKYNENGKPYLIAGVGAVTLINGLPLNVIHMNRYSGPEQFSVLTAETKRTLKQLVELNEGAI